MSMFHGNLHRVADRLEPTHVLPNPFALSEKRSFNRAVPNALFRNPWKVIRSKVSVSRCCSPNRATLKRREGKCIRERRMGQAQQPPITVIEPENLETVFIAGGQIEAILKPFA
jgi:hypothetical protein